MDPSEINPGDKLWWNQGKSRTPCEVKCLWTNPKGRIWVKIYVLHTSEIDGEQFQLEHLISPKSLSKPYPS